MARRWLAITCFVGVLVQVWSLYVAFANLAALQAPILSCGFGIVAYAVAVAIWPKDWATTTNDKEQKNAETGDS